MNDLPGREKNSLISRVKTELRHHAPFTAAGAASGIVLLIIFSRMRSHTALDIFHTLHPAHVFLSALVTSSMYQLHKCGKLKGKCSLGVLLLIGYFGSVGIATLSDSLIPYIGEALMGLPNRGAHLGFIEKWYIVNPLAGVGVAVAYFRPSTKFPHAAHVLLSTWASLFHIMSAGGNMGVGSYAVVIDFLFIAVWLPCCVSDIVFPLLFVKE